MTQPGAASTDPDPVAEAEALLEPALAHASEQRARGEQRYLKLPHWTFLGIATPPLRAAEKQWSRARRGLSHDHLWSVVDVLWSTPGPVFEHRRLVSLLIERHWRLLEVGDGERLEELLATAETWALVDAIACAVGLAVEEDPAWNEVLDGWARHPSFWLRRSALLALMKPLGHGRGDWPRLCRYAEDMLEEEEFFIRKAIGWVLRAASRHRPEEVGLWLAERTQRCSGLTVREGSRHLDEAVHRELVSACKQRRAARICGPSSAGSPTAPQVPGE